MVILHAQRKALGILDEQPFNVVAHRVFPGVANADVERQCGGSNYRDKSRHGLKEDTVPHFDASNLYPAPRTVLRY